MRIAFSGDIAVTTSTQNDLVSNEVGCVLRAVDYSFACFEAPFFDGELHQYSKVGPHLRQDHDVEKLLPYFTHFSFANNHIMDYGVNGAMATQTKLMLHNITTLGWSALYPQMYEPVIVEKDGVRVAVFAWAEAQYGCCKSADDKVGYAWLFNPYCYRLIQEYKCKVDYVIVYLHAGLEDESIPLLDWRIQYRNYIDFGADLVVGGHPHIMQGKELYKDRWIYYSLGNLYFNGEYALNTEDFCRSIILECDFTKDDIRLKETFVDFCSGKIELSDDLSLRRFNYLTEILCSENQQEYICLYEAMIDRCWEEYYRFYYSFPIWRDKGDAPLYKRIFNKLMKGYVYRCFEPAVSLNKIYHNINIDTHRFVVSRVCAKKVGTY